MSKFYGTVRDPWGGRGTGTRCGHRGIRTTAQSFDGSVIVDMSYGDGGKLEVEVEVAEGSATFGETVFSGGLEELVEALRAGTREV